MVQHSQYHQHNVITCITVSLALTITFFSQHILGFNTQPRRYVDYADALYYWNTVATYGSILFVVALWVAYSTCMRPASGLLLSVPPSGGAGPKKKKKKKKKKKLRLRMGPFGEPCVCAWIMYTCIVCTCVCCHTSVWPRAPCSVPCMQGAGP